MSEEGFRHRGERGYFALEGKAQKRLGLGHGRHGEGVNHVAGQALRELVVRAVAHEAGGVGVERVKRRSRHQIC